jgi:hypothetical protein
LGGHLQEDPRSEITTASALIQIVGENFLN